MLSCFAKYSRVVLVSLGVFSVSVCGAALADGAEETPPAGLSVSARYAASVLVFPVGRVDLNARIENSQYIADTYVEAAGLAALFTDFDISAQVEGRVRPRGVRPTRYSHRERTGHKVRNVEVTFPGRVATSAVTPPFGSWGVPPASDDDRRHAMDPMSAVFILSDVLATGETGCEGELPVFDGKQRYDLRLVDRGMDEVRTRAWRGEARVCDVYYSPVSGYDPEDLPSEDEMRHPLTIWLAPFADHNVHVPVRAHTRAGFGGVTIEAISLDVGVLE